MLFFAIILLAGAIIHYENFEKGRPPFSIPMQCSLPSPSHSVQHLMKPWGRFHDVCWCFSHSHKLTTQHSRAKCCSPARLRSHNIIRLATDAVCATVKYNITFILENTRKRANSRLLIYTHNNEVLDDVTALYRKTEMFMGTSF